jgi:hypothetical protein
MSLDDGHHSDSEERKEDSQEARAESMDETSFSLESSPSRGVQDYESGRDSQGSEEDVPTDPDFPVIPKKLDHSLIDTSNLEAWQWNLEKAKRKFGPYFVDEEQLEMFCLLPLSNTQRVQLLQTIRSKA